MPNSPSLSSSLKFMYRVVLLLAAATLSACEYSEENRGSAPPRPPGADVGWVRIDRTPSVVRVEPIRLLGNAYPAGHPAGVNPDQQCPTSVDIVINWSNRSTGTDGTAGLLLSQDCGCGYGFCNCICNVRWATRVPLDFGENVIEVFPTRGSAVGIKDSVTITRAQSSPPPPLNKSPAAAGDIVIVPMIVPIDIDVLSNDFDADGDPLTVISVTQGSKGVSSINADGTVHYEPRVPFSSVDSFTYTVSDGRLGLSVATVTIALAFPSGLPIERMSVASDGTQNRSNSYAEAVSPDGRYVTISTPAGNLIPGVIWFPKHDVLIRDRSTNQTSLVSVDLNGNPGGGAYSAVSTGGRYVAFLSSDTNLVAGDTNGAQDIFVRDRETAITTRVSVSSNGIEGNGHSSRPSISADGRYIAFRSGASNLVPNDGNGSIDDVFVHDRRIGKTEHRGTSVAWEGPSISADGRYLASGRRYTKIISHGDLVGRQGTQVGVGQYPVISADGRYVAFNSVASDLVPGDTNGWYDVFVYDAQTRQTTRVSVASDGTEADGGVMNWRPAISGDGRYVAFVSGAANLVENDTNLVDDVFVHDRQTGQTARVSVDSSGVEADDSSHDRVAITTLGDYIVFTSRATNLVAGDTNGSSDVFIAPNPLKP